MGLKGLGLETIFMGPLGFGRAPIRVVPGFKVPRLNIEEV